MLGTWRIRKLCCGWHARWLQLLSRVAQCSGMPLQEGFEGIAQIAGQVPAIRNLDRTRRTLLRALGKGIRAITRDDRHAGVFLEPGGKLLGAVIRQQIEHLMALKIYGAATEGVVRVGLVGTYAIWKGHILFLEAAARVLGRIPGDRVRFYVVGGAVYSTRGSQVAEEELRARAAALGIARDVGFVG